MRLKLNFGVKMLAKEKNIVHIGVVGVGGYSAKHLKMIQICSEMGLCILGAVFIRNPQKEEYLNIIKELKTKGVRIYTSYNEMLLEEQKKLDLITIPCSIDQHAGYSNSAMIHGYHVLCEKPVAGTYKEAVQMKMNSEKYNKILAIGYQNIFSKSVQRIKSIALQGQLGNMLKAKAWICRPRTSVYYDRNDWAGKIEFNGRKIYDSPIQNAASHQLNTLLYVAGSQLYESANITKVYGENYKIKNIECADTQYLKVWTESNIPIYFYATHASEEVSQSLLEFHFEKGRIVWDCTGKNSSKVFEYDTSGQDILIEEIDNGDIDPVFNVFLNTIESIRNGEEPLCTVQNSMQQTLSVEMSFRSSGGVIQIPKEFSKTISNTQKPSDENIIIENIESNILQMFNQEIGFYEYGFTWAKPGKIIDII